MRRALTFVVALIMFAPSAFADELKVGDKAPDFELQGTDGKVHKLSDYEGKQAVVIAWFPKALTPGCTAECKSMRASGDALRKFEVAYFTASCDEPQLNKQFSDKLDLDFPILSDPAHKISDAFGVTGSGRAFPQRWTFYIGKDGKILAIDKQVKTANHGADIAARLKELGIPEKS